MLAVVGVLPRLLRFFLFLALVGTGAAKAAESLIPLYADAVHLGVSSCAGSSCHSSLVPWQDSTVLQNEYVSWFEDDPHSKAYQVLLSDESQRIASNLGIEAAHEADLCLDCHADNVPAELRAKGFQISDGVGCEACHGGGVNWLGIHVSGVASHSENVAAGMYPTEEPVARARLCLSCHFGDKNRFVTHRIMGAGHPRMSFELDTFTATQPAHYVIDQDYKVRKRVANRVQVWAVGQAYAFEALLDAMLDPNRNQDGIFPELVFFDCHACHHPMSNVRWQPRESHSIGPGIPRINDSNLVMLSVILDHVDPLLAEKFRANSKQLHQAAMSGHEATLKAAASLKALTTELVQMLSTHNFGASDMRLLLGGLITRGLEGEYADYAAAEQATMAASAILQAMLDAEVIDEDQYLELMDVMSTCYEAVEKDEEYNPREFLAALQALEMAVPRL